MQQQKIKNKFDVNFAHNNLQAYLKDKKEIVNKFLEKYFKTNFSPQVLHESMIYSLFADGKRLRPILCLAGYEIGEIDSQNILPQACAIELIHTFSLIHDDLPAIDNDDLRRGKLSNHKKFGDAIAILAGDSLLIEAFEMFLQNNKLIAPQVLLEALRELTNAIGTKGLAAGETMDVLCEGKEADEKTLEFIHYHKTAKFIQASVKIGGILAGANSKTLKALESYGKNLGLAFQIIDDILDITQTTEQLGKPQGSDVAKKKMTYPALMGLEKSKEKAVAHIKQATTALEFLGKKAFWLNQIADYVLTRIN